jgi:hypothetical protein
MPYKTKTPKPKLWGLIFFVSANNYQPTTIN